MRVLVTYDVCTVTVEGQRRLRRVARACEDYGQRVQKSVFECQLGRTEWALLRQRLLGEANLNEDSLRVYSWTRELGSSIMGSGYRATLRVL